MVLASQSGRAVSGRRYMASRRKKKSKLPTFIALAIIGGGVWYFMSGDSDNTPDEDLANANIENKKIIDQTPAALPIRSKVITKKIENIKPVETIDTGSPVPDISKTITRRNDSDASAPVNGFADKTRFVSNPRKNTQQPTTPATVPLEDNLRTFIQQDNAELAKGFSLLTQDKLVEGRALLSKLLTTDESLSEHQQSIIRTRLAKVNDILIFSKEVRPNDPLVGIHVTSREALFYSTIAKKHDITHELMFAINKVSPRKLSYNKKLKYVKGPFIAEVVKSAFRMDLFLEDDRGNPIYIRSFDIGLGADDSTPEGAFVIQNKVPNPGWTNPRTREKFDRDDPKNPIGEFWLALKGTDDFTKNVKSYGIHGTNEPDSVGKQQSMGCIRMLAKDVKLVYHLLIPTKSTVIISGE